MANVIYDKYKEALLSAANNVSLSGEVVKISLVDSGQTMFGSTDEFVADLNSANGIISTSTLTGTTVASGVFDADDVVFVDVANTEPESEALMIWIDTGDANTDRLVAWMDANIVGLPITPDGANVNITWSTSGIFKL